MLVELLRTFNTEILPLVYKIIFVLSPVLVPVILGYILVLLWVKNVQLKYIAKQKPVLLEIKIPKDIQKSPLAMEVVLGIMQQNGAATYTEAYIDGKVPPWFSLELVSFEGEIHFYIWMSEAKFKPLIEAQIYAQYPTVEIYDVSNEKDYVRHFNYTPEKHVIWGIQYGLTKKDVYPIKTYVDYGLDKDQKDEYKIDPMTAVLEFFGSAKKGHNLWMQILIRRHDKRDLKSFRLKATPDWKKEAEKEIKEIRELATPEPVGDYPGFPNPTKGQIEKIGAIERSLGKMAFDCCIRGFYLANKEVFNPLYITGLISANRQYSSNELNGFKLKTKTDTSDAFKDWCTVFPFLRPKRDATQEKYRRLMLNAYRLRSFFHPPFKHYGQNPFILNAEEIATIYHFPGNVSATPTLAKIPSKKSEPPSNLPIKR